MPPIPILDFKPTKPTHMEALQDLSNHFTSEMQKLADFMSFLHENQLIIMRKMVDKKIITPPQLIEMIHETPANNMFRLLLNELETKYIEENSGGMKVKVKKSFKHKLKDFVSGKDTSVKLKVEQEKK